MQSQDELLEFMQTWGFAISFATCQPGNRSEYIHGGGASLRSQQRGYSLKPVHSGTVPSMRRQFFGRPFIKRFALCYRTIVLSVCMSVCLSVCLSDLSVCNVGVLWPNGWMDQDETWHAGRPVSRPHCVRWGPSPPQRGAVPQFSAHVYCGQTVAHLSYCWALVFITLFVYWFRAVD